MATGVPLALDTYAEGFLTPTWALFAVALIVLIARIYTSFRLTEVVAIDLYLAVLTFILASISIAFFTVAVCYGLGQHVDALSIDQRIESMRWSWRFVGVSLIAIPVGKLTIIAFLQLLHAPDARWRDYFLWTLGASNLVVNAITVGVALSSCTPRAKLWDVRLEGECNGILRNEYCAFFQGSWNAMADLLLALYPITLLYRLQLRVSFKVGLAVLMGLGIIACACAIVKTVKLENLEHTHDTTYYVGQLNFWNSTEMWVVFIVSCIPPIRRLLVITLGKINATFAFITGSRHSAVEVRGGASIADAQQQHVEVKCMIEEGRDSEERLWEVGPGWGGRCIAWGEVKGGEGVVSRIC